MGSLSLLSTAVCSTVPYIQGIFVNGMEESRAHCVISVYIIVIVTVMEVSPMLKPSQSYPPYCHCDGGVSHVKAQSILPSILSL